MTEFEHKILREIAGELPCSPWGAAVSAALEALAGNGYITSIFHGEITEKGHEALSKGKFITDENGNKGWIVP